LRAPGPARLGLNVCVDLGFDPANSPPEDKRLGDIARIHAPIYRAGPHPKFRLQVCEREQFKVLNHRLNRYPIL
jgi:hypothetical protein